MKTITYLGLAAASCVLFVRACRLLDRMMTPPEKDVAAWTRVMP